MVFYTVFRPKPIHKSRLSWAWWKISPSEDNLTQVAIDVYYKYLSKSSLKESMDIYQTLWGY